MEFSQKEKEEANRAVSLAFELGSTYEPVRALDDALRSLLRKEKRKRVWKPESAELMNCLKEIRKDTSGTTALLVIDTLNPGMLKKVCFSDISEDYSSLKTYPHLVFEGMAGAGFSPVYQRVIKYTDENKEKALLMVDKLISGMTAEESKRISPKPIAQRRR